MVNTGCLICKGTNFTELLHIDNFPVFFGAIPSEKRNQIQSFPLTIAICDQCHLIQQVGLLEEDILKRVYTEEYYNCPSPLATGMGTREIDRFYNFFLESNLKKGKILEIACFDGYLLKKLQKDGWDVYGCDPSALTQIAIDYLGPDRVIHDFFTAETYPPESFDVIIFRNLLEHLYDIHSFIQAISQCLKRGGRILIDVPNVKVLLNIGGFGTFFHQHVSYFSLHTLSRFLGRHHFAIEEYYEGNPNLFVSAKKRLDEPEIFNSADISFNVTAEKALFLQKNNQVKEKILKIFRNPDYQRIALFGASVLATTIINYLEKNLVSKMNCIFDNDSLKHGKYIYGCDVCITSPIDIKDFYFDVILISTYFFEKEISRQLINLGVDPQKILILN